MSKVASVERLVEVFEELLDDKDFLKDTVVFVVLDGLEKIPHARDMFITAANVRMLSKAHKDDKGMPENIKVSDKLFRDTMSDDFVKGFTHACAFFIVKDICDRHGVDDSLYAMRNVLFNSVLEQIDDFANFEYKEEYGEKRHQD